MSTINTRKKNKMWKIYFIMFINYDVVLIIKVLILCYW
jgi:hypothetical protein